MKFLILSAVYLASLSVLPATVDSLSLRDDTALVDKCLADCNEEIKVKCTEDCKGDLYCVEDCMGNAATEWIACEDKCIASIL